MKQKWKQFFWRVLRKFHHLDFLLLLPLLAQLPFVVGFPIAKFRGHINAWLGRDWRSMALGFRHIPQQTIAGLKLMNPKASDVMIHTWLKERFIAEAQDEYDAQLLAHHRVDSLRCDITPHNWDAKSRQSKRGILMLTPHYESFVMGIAFLARSGYKVNAMSSSVTHDPRVDLAVQKHFTNKYRGLEYYLNGGLVVDMESKMRSFYRMLEANEILVMLADAPALQNGVATEVDFLGQRRIIAGGAIRLAQKTNSLIGGYVCQCTGPGKYAMEVHCPTAITDPNSISSVYQFFSDTITKNPGGWWAADMLPNIPPVTK